MQSSRVRRVGTASHSPNWWRRITPTCWGSPGQSLVTRTRRGTPYRSRGNARGSGSPLCATRVACARGCFRAGNEARRAVRGSRRSAGFLSPDVLADLPAFPPHADSDNLGYEDFALEQALDRLDPRDRELLSLRYVLGFSSVELSAHCGLSPEGIRSRLKRVLDRIRGELTDE